MGKSGNGDTIFGKNNKVGYRVGLIQRAGFVILSGFAGLRNSGFPKFSGFAGMRVLRVFSGFCVIFSKNH